VDEEGLSAAEVGLSEGVDGLSGTAAGLAEGLDELFSSSSLGTDEGFATSCLG
jgi:hypothetical protein